MKTRTIITLLLATALLAGCAHKKKAVSPTAGKEQTEKRKSVSLQERVIAAQPAFSSMQAYKARFSINYEQRQITTNGTVSLITDSLFIISLQPVLGIELYRLEATRDEVLVIDKMNKRYAAMNYHDLQQKTGLPVTFADIQAIAMNRLFVIGQPQTFVLEKAVVADKQASRSSLILNDGRISYTYLIDTNLLMPLSLEARMNNNGDHTTIKYSGHTPRNGTVYPSTVSFAYKSTQTEGSAEITMPNIVFETTSITRLKTNNYKKTTLGAIIPGL